MTLRYRPTDSVNITIGRRPGHGEVAPYALTERTALSSGMDFVET
jgi:hypothetical protein